MRCTSAAEVDKLRVHSFTHILQQHVR